ncbi:shikimate 3-dehydrogenase [Aureococcus anophagefferens]|nr:shikimate 3-dehydrogenase [Aureococcus anophagefferens]
MCVSRRVVALLALCQRSLAFAAPRARAQRLRSLRGDAVDGPVVLVGEGKFGDETAALAAASAAELGGRVHHVWVRCVNEFGNDNVGEIFRENAAKTRYEVAACGPYADPDASDVASRAAWGGGAKEVARLARFGSAPRLARERVDLEAGHDTFFVSLTFDDYGEQEARDCVAALSRDAAAGAYADDDAAGMEALLRLGLRAGVDWLDVEARTLSKKVCRELKAEAAKRGATLVLGSDHALGARTAPADAQKMMASIEAKTKCDAAKLVLDAAASDDVAAAAACASDVPGGPPRVALALGDAGVASRVLCTRFLPATHELLPSAAAPGQISPKTALALRETLGVTRRRDYFVLLESDFGSRSPAMHNAAFQACGLPHVLELPKDGGLADLASATAADFRALLAKPSFGGLSVTIPHKQLVQPFLDELTDAAEAIGAVNTVTPRARTAAIDAVSLGGSRPVLVGDNTDWIGICATLEDALARRGARAATGKALVVGSGGTARAACYALTKGFARRTGAGFDLLVYARDVAKAEALAAAFGGEAVARLDGGASMLVKQGVAQFEQWTRRVAPEPAMRAAVFEGR